MIVGAGGVGQVVTHKCAQVPEVFGEIVLASRTEEKCKRIATQIERPIKTAQVDADDVGQMSALIEREKPAIVINVALPYQDLPIMDACLATGVDYLDTANYEPRDAAKFEYGWQWAYHDRYRERGIMALLGSGFDPGATNVFTAYLAKHHFDTIEELDIIDCNAGDHGQPFATNFNPEINIREITVARPLLGGRRLEDDRAARGQPHARLSRAGIGPKKIFLLYHEELESIVRHFPTLRRARFWMTFSENYLTHLRVLGNVGMTSIKPVPFQGREIVPLQFLKALLPDPGEPRSAHQGHDLHRLPGARAQGRQGEARVRLQHLRSRGDCYREVQAQAISYTTGVPAMIGAKLMVTGKWRGKGVFNLEQFDPDPFMADMNQHGLPWKVIEPDAPMG